MNDIQIVLLLFVIDRAIMVCHKEFVDAGKKPGLQVWRIENLDLKPVPKALHGNFYTGDAYLLLFTTSAPSYNIHMWLGKTFVHVQEKREGAPSWCNDFNFFVITVFQKPEPSCSAALCTLP